MQMLQDKSKIFATKIQILKQQVPIRSITVSLAKAFITVLVKVGLTKDYFIVTER
jgi:hypothetical protein